MAKVYVSSTVLDLRAERDAVMEWLVARGHQPVHSYTPSGENVRDSCLADIDGCDLLVLILGHRYGSGEDLSITHEEFRRADKIPRIALLRTVIDEKRSDVRDPVRLAKVLAFRDEVAAAVRAAEFADLTELVVGLSTGVERVLDRSGEVEGWLAAQAAALAAQFADRMPDADGDPAARYVELAVVKRGTAEARPLAELLTARGAPVLLTGEGGAGKSAALLHLATGLATRALTDPTAPVPVYVDLAKLTALADVPDLQRLIVDAVPMAADWAELTSLLRGRRPHYFLDAFNEMPEHLQRTAATVLRRFLDKHRDQAGFLVTSRATPLVDQLGADPYEVLRLRPEQVREFLERAGLGSLYARLPGALRDLAGNPFMLGAIARTLAGTTDSDMPSTRGGLYGQFVDGWMRREQDRRTCAYHFERVKRPLLADLATRMTVEGRTVLAVDEDVAALIEARLAAIHAATRRRGGMPADWTVDGFLAEVADDGLLRRRGDDLLFGHQSVQEYFTALRFADDAVALAELTPTLDARQVSDIMLTGLPDHRLVPALLMLAGILDDAAAVVTTLAERHPVLAAAALAAARVQPAARERLIGGWVADLRGSDPDARGIACSCLALVDDPGPEAIAGLVELLFSGPPHEIHRAEDALVALRQDHQQARAFVARVLTLDEDAIADADLPIYIGGFRRLLPEMLFIAVLERLRETPDALVRVRLARLVATFQDSALDDIKRMLANLPSRIAEADEILAEAATQPGLTAAGANSHRWDDNVRRATEAVARWVAELRSADAAAVAVSLRSSDPFRSYAAGEVAAERGLPLDGLIAAALLDGRIALVKALVALCGPERAVALIRGAVGGGPRRLGVLPEGVDPGPTADGLLTPPAAAAVAALAPDADVREASHYGLPGRRVWRLGGSHEIRESAEGLVLVAPSRARCAVGALGSIEGDAAQEALRAAVDSADPDAVREALRLLARRGDTSQVSRVIARLRRTEDPELAEAILDGLAAAESPETAVLVEDLLRADDDRAEQIHKVLRRAGADAQIHAALRRALRAGPHRAAAVSEFGRWFDDYPFTRAAAWASPPRLRRFVGLALRDPEAPVRAAAVAALRRVGTDGVWPALAAELDDPDMAALVAAGELVLAIRADKYLPKRLPAPLQHTLVDRLQAVLQGPADLTLRQRAGVLLGALPHGLDSFHDPIVAALDRDDPRAALELTDAATTILPGDVNVWWWRGHALYDLDRPAEAALSYQKAFELNPTLPGTAQEAANALMDAGEPRAAVEWAGHAVAAGPLDSVALSVLAWAHYDAGDNAAALAACRDALDRDPIHPTARWLVAFALLRQGDDEAGRAAVADARRVDELLLRAPQPWLDAELDAVCHIDTSP